jgi:protein NrfD
MQTDTVATQSRTDIDSSPGNRYTGPTYHGLPTVKPSVYGSLVSSYMFIAGLAGGSQIIATVADFLDEPRLDGVVRNGRYLALAGSVVGSVLLIADLHTPKRWYNMFRIFRKTSPMSIGTYILSTFSVGSGIAASAQFLGDVQRPGFVRQTARIAQIPAALAGAGMTTYTGALLSSTSTPLWAAAPRLLTARFATSAIATAAAALSLGEQFGGDRRSSTTLARLACVATVADAALTIAVSKRYQAQGVDAALKDPKAQGRQYKLATGLAHVLPLALYGLNAASTRRSGALSAVAALGVLVGGFLMRSTILRAGNSSACRPQDYFALTRPEDPS